MFLLGKLLYGRAVAAPDAEAHAGTDRRAVSAPDAEAHAGTDRRAVSAPDAKAYAGADRRAVAAPDAATVAVADDGALGPNIIYKLDGRSSFIAEAAAQCARAQKQRRNLRFGFAEAGEENCTAAA